jgi:hypothetical protein
MIELVDPSKRTRHSKVGLSMLNVNVEATKERIAVLAKSSSRFGESEMSNSNAAR